MLDDEFFFELSQSEQEQIEDAAIVDQAIQMDIDCSTAELPKWMHS